MNEFRPVSVLVVDAGLRLLGRSTLWDGRTGAVGQTAANRECVVGFVESCLVSEVLEVTVSFMKSWGLGGVWATGKISGSMCRQAREI